MNKSVYETVDMKFNFYGCRETSKEYSYTDTGYSKEHKFGYGYNGEALDDTGFIYLRARYYNPRIGQFIQLDTYQGEQDSIESQNRYAYTMNNPYKYVDRGGNTTFHEMTYGTKPKPANTKTPKKNTTVYPPHSYQGWSDLNSKKPNKPSKPKPPKGNSNGDKGKTNDRPSKTEDEFKEELEDMKALIAPDPEPCPDIDLREKKKHLNQDGYYYEKKGEIKASIYRGKEKTESFTIAMHQNLAFKKEWNNKESIIKTYNLISAVTSLITLGTSGLVQEISKASIKSLLSEIGFVVAEQTLIEIEKALKHSNSLEEDIYNILLMALGAQFGGVFFVTTVIETLIFNISGVNKFISEKSQTLVEATAMSTPLDWRELLNSSKYDNATRTKVEESGQPMNINYVELMAKKFLLNNQMSSSYPVGEFTYGKQLLKTYSIYY